MHTSFKHFCLLLILVNIFHIGIAQECESLKLLLKNGNILEASTLANQIDVNKIESECLNTLGELYLKNGEFDKASSAFQKAYEKSNTIESKAESYNNLALAAWSRGDYNEANDFMQSALKLRLEIKNGDALAATYNDFGLVLSNSDLNSSLNYYEKALNLYGNTTPIQQEKIAQTKINIAIIYKNLEFYGDAILNLESALSSSLLSYPQGHPTQAFINYNLGQVAESMNHQEDALTYYGKALELYKETLGNKHPEIAVVYNSMGNVVNKTGDFEQALNYYQEALIANSYNFESSSIELNPAADNYISANTLLNTLFYKAKALEDYHFTYTLDFKDLKLSLSTLYACDTLIDKMRQTSSNEKDKIALSDLASQVYESGVVLSYTMSDLVLKKIDYLKSAFYFSEKSKSAVLIQAINAASAKSFASLPAEALKKENQLKRNILFYEQKIINQSNFSDQKNKNTLTQLNQEYKKFIKELEVKYPKYYDLKYNTVIPTIEQLQYSLDDETAIFSYFIADKTSRLFVFEISKKDFKIENINQTENFDRYISGFRNSIYFKSEVVYKLTGIELFNFLFPNGINKNIKHLIIIPSGRLGTIPFEALLTEKIKKNNFDYATLPYLIKKVDVSYQFASTLYFQKSKSIQTSIHSKNALLCAPVEFNGFSKLEETRTEINGIAKQLNSKGFKTDVLLETEASESTFRARDLFQYNYIHLATHGLVNESKPNLSRVILREANDDAFDDNLYSGELYNLNLNASLVTLSACETGLGKISKGEGIIGLSRALVYAGANNLVVSLWNVADNSTSQLMVDFYNNISKQNYSTAIRIAKIKMISNQYSQPYYWAPFVLIGN